VRLQGHALSRHEALVHQLGCRLFTLDRASWIARACADERWPARAIHDADHRRDFGWCFEVGGPLKAGSAPEDAGGVTIGLIEELLDVGRGVREVILVELEVPVSPVH
jgi:hypothetical protein